jgi:hypothetical protein
VSDDGAVIHPFKGDYVVGKREVNAHVVHDLEEALQMAKDGEINGICLVANKYNAETTTWCEGMITQVMLGGVWLAMSKLTEHLIKD